MPPNLLPQKEMQALQGLFYCLVGSETGPFMVIMGSTERCEIQILSGLSNPVQGSTSQSINR